MKVQSYSVLDDLVLMDILTNIYSSSRLPTLMPVVFPSKVVTFASWLTSVRGLVLVPRLTL
jgi:hypothetical protein